MPPLDPWFFGYGSLVNRATHDFAKPQAARLKGWRRAWRHTDLRPVAFLTAVPDPDCEIDGLIAQVPRGDWGALDQREWAYDRVAVTPSVTHGLCEAAEIAVYAVPPARQNTPDEMYPVLLSYIDVVVQGYLREFGQDGVRAFFATTSGWDTPVLDDRAAPRYPRHQALSAAERDFVDAALADCGARIVQPGAP